MQHQAIIQHIRTLYNKPEGFIPLHAPVFGGNEKKYLLDCIDSTYVSSVGEYVNRFEQMMCELTGATYCCAIGNGTLALHLAMVTAGVEQNDEVITQALTFIATANAISYIGAQPVFLDVDADTLGLSPAALEQFLKEHCEVNEKGECINKRSRRRVTACVPMHTFGFPARIDEIAALCKQWNIALIEDAAESIGSFYKQKHTGTFGQMGTFSFNGNKTVTCGGGGAIVTNDEEVFRLAKHLSTQAKTPHAWEFNHDMNGYNYRLPNLNAALACAQLEQLNNFVQNKRDTAAAYKQFFAGSNIQFVDEPADARANFWLNAIWFPSHEEQQAFLKLSNDNGVMTRPCWTLMTDLPMYKNSEHDSLTHAKDIASRLVNLPSSVRA